MNKIKKYVEEFYLQHGTSPSTSKIAEGVGIVKSTAYKYLVEMVEMKRKRRKPREWREILRLDLCVKIYFAPTSCFSPKKAL